MNLSLKQTRALDLLEDNQTTEVLFGGSAGGGKSVIGAYWVLKNCFKYPKSRWLIGRAELKVLKETTLISFFEVCNIQGLRAGVHYRYNQQDSSVTTANGSVILFKDLDYYPSDPNFDSLGSLEITGAFIDECNQLVSIAKEVVKSRIRFKLDHFGIIPKLLMTCNPAKNWVYHDFYLPSKQGQLPKDKAFIQSLVTDNPFISKHYIDNLRGMKDKALRERLLNGNWEYDDDPSRMIEYDAIVKSFSNRPPEGYRKISCDVARFGKDKTVIGIWNGLLCEQIITIDKSDLTYVANLLRKEASIRGMTVKDIVVDEDGVGGGVVDMLKCQGFTANGAVQKVHGVTPNYANLKSQCAFKLAEMMNEGSIGIKAPNTDVIKTMTEELEQLKQDRIEKDFTKLIIVGKDKMKEQLGRSPDYLDMLIMRMYFEIKPNVYVY